MTDIDKLLEWIAYRFLAWKLPEDFQPDCGIEFDRNKYVRLNPMNRPFEPVGTNLFSFTQATAMVKAIAGPEIEALLDALTTEREKVAKLEAEKERLREALEAQLDHVRDKWIAEAARWREVVRQCAEADDALNEQLKQDGGCGDGNCMVHVRGGQHTNGGCRCMTSKWTAERIVMAHRVFQGAIRAALTRYKQESGQ